MVKKLDHFFKKLVRAEQEIGAALLLVMLIICFGAIVMRYVLNRPWVWSDEIILILLVPFGYCCISIDVYRDEHVALTGLYKKMPEKVRTVLDVFRHVIIGVFFGMMVHYAYQIMQVKLNKKLPATGLSAGIVFVVQFVMAILTVIYCVMNVVKELAKYQDEDQKSEEVEG